MKFISMLKAVAFMLVGLTFVNDASATGSCSVTGVTLTSMSYTNAALTNNGTVSWSCTRSSSGDGSPFTVNFTFGAGLNSRKVHSGTNLIPYSLSNPIGNAVFVGTGAASNTVAGSFPFTFSMAASLNPVSNLTYVDTVSITGTCTDPKPATCTVPLSTFNLSISVDTPVSCTISPATIPALLIAYTSFQTLPGAGNTSFDANCSNGGPYRMSVSPTSGTLLGLPYTLKLGTSANSATDISSTTTYNLTGAVSPATYYINGTIPSDLGGICSTGTCSDTSPAHTLKVEF